MAGDVILTRELPTLPDRTDDVHKGELGRLAIIGGCHGAVTMAGAVGLAANAAFRSGVGLVQVICPAALHASMCTIVPEATFRDLVAEGGALLSAVQEFGAEVLLVGPGLGSSFPCEAIAELLNTFTGPVVLDADGLNALARAPRFDIPEASRIVLTPHAAELDRLLAARGDDRGAAKTQAARRAAACALVNAYGGPVVVLKGRGTVVTNGQRLYVNETGNWGMATAGSGDVLAGVIGGLIGPGHARAPRAAGLAPFEAAILGVYLHGLAGDFAAEELGRRSMMAGDIVEFLPDAFCEYQLADQA